MKHCDLKVIKSGVSPYQTLWIKDQKALCVQSVPAQYCPVKVSESHSVKVNVLLDNQQSRFLL